MSNLSQINFFKWAVQYKVLDYIEKNYSVIVKDMTETINNTPSQNKRRIFSKSSTKSFKKYDDGITVDIPLQNININKESSI